MNYKELRIGNLVNVSGKPETVTGILPFGCYFHLLYYPFNLSQIEPIELTKDWLLKFGFKPEKDVKIFWKIKTSQKSITLEVEPNSGRTILFDNKGIKFIDVKPIKHVHQIQNLYFSITGKELTIKEDEIEKK